MTLRTRLVVEWLMIAVFSSALVVFLILTGIAHRLDNIVYDVGLSFQTIDPSDDIIVVSIDEPSLSELGAWPWPRNEYVPLIDTLGKAGADAIAIDILFTEPSAINIPIIDDNTNPDALLAKAIKRNGKVVLPVQFLRPGSNGRDQDRIDPIKPIRDAAATLGHVELPTDDDTVVRRVAMCLNESTDGKTPHLMTAALNLRQENLGKELFAPPCDTLLAMPFLPVSAFRTASFHSVAKGEVPDSFFKDKIVLVGVTATGLGDQHRVPAVSGELSPGIIVMANALNALIQDRFITPVPLWAQIILALLPLWILLGILWRSRPRNVIIFALILLALTILSSMILLQMQIWFAPAATVIALILVYPIWGWRRLQAVSDYMGRELDRMDIGSTEVPIIDQRFRPVDLLTEQSEKLASAIAKLRDMRRFVTDTVTNLPDPMVVVDEKAYVVMANQGAETIFGPELTGKDLHDCLTLLARPDNQQQLLDYLDTAPEQTEGNVIFEFRTLEDQHYAMRRSAVLSNDGQRLGTIFYFADITEIRRANREREEVLQLLSHDMRGPQASILALLEQNQSNTPATLRQRIARQARRTLSLADNFVDMARMTERPFTPEDIVYSDLITEASQDLWPMASARNIRFDINDESDTAFVAAEPESMSRAFINLFDNAVKYSPENGTIYVTIDRTTLDGEDYVRCIIEDEGKGIEGPIKDKLFSAFASTGDTNKTSKVSGIGLGLHYVQTVIIRHGGTITAQNGEKGGARFTLLLPMLPEYESEDV